MPFFGKKVKNMEENQTESHRDINSNIVVTKYFDFLINKSFICEHVNTSYRHPTTLFQ